MLHRGTTKCSRVTYTQKTASYTCTKALTICTCTHIRDVCTCKYQSKKHHSKNHGALRCCFDLGPKLVVSVRANLRLAMARTRLLSSYSTHFRREDIRMGCGVMWLYQDSGAAVDRLTDKCTWICPQLQTLPVIQQLSSCQLYKTHGRSTLVSAVELPRRKSRPPVGVVFSAPKVARSSDVPAFCLVGFGAGSF